jgi:predicted nucleic acid-binding protein
MSGVLVDSSVLLDIFTEDAKWMAWSSAALAAAADASRLVINPIVFAEVSVRFSKIEELDAKLPPDTFVREPLPFDAAFLAGKAFLRYRRRGGERAAPLPDFFIGAHAAVAGHRLLTRDPTRVRTYFPSLVLIAP